MAAKFERYSDAVAQEAYRELRRNAAKSASRALNVLEYFGEEARPLRAAEISRVFHLSPSSTDQLLKTLVDSAYLNFNPRTKLYFPSLRLLGFANMLMANYGGDRVHRLIAELRSATGEAVWVVTLCDTRIQVVESLEYHENGVKFAIDSIPGAVLLAQHSDAAIQQIVDRAILYGRCSKDRAPMLIRSSLSARNAGYAGGESLRANWWTISFPLTRASTDIPIALSLAGETSRIRSKEAELVRVIRANIERVLH